VVIDICGGLDVPPEVVVWLPEGVVVWLPDGVVDEDTQTPFWRT
jgi:hypothetical protein